MNVRYKSGNNNKSIVALMLVDHDDRYSCLRSDKLANSEIDFIRNNAKEINKMDIADRIRWFKEYIPSYKTAYRELKKENTTIIETHEI